MHVLRLAAAAQSIRPPDRGAARATRAYVRRQRGAVVRTLVARFAAPRLDRRIAAGEPPSGDPLLARRSVQLVSGRSRRQLARGLERAAFAERDPVVSAAVPVNDRAVEVAEPAIRQLATALRSRLAVDARGVALTHLLLTEPCSALYRPAYPEEVYELAREALFALGSGG